VNVAVLVCGRFGCTPFMRLKVGQVSVVSVTII